MCVKLTKAARFKIVACTVNMHYLARETMELVLNEGLDLGDFSDSGSEENIVDSGEEFVPVDLEVDSSDSDNNIFIFIIGIRATSKIKLFFFFFTVWTVPTLLFRQRKGYDMTLWIIYLTSTHPKLSKNISVYCIIPSSLFTTIFFQWAKTVRLQRPSVPFCGILNELRPQQQDTRSGCMGGFTVGRTENTL